MILQKFPFGPLETNTILVGCILTKKAAVIDPSLGSTAAILAKCAEMQLQIEKILITHSHWDHIADAHELMHKTSAPVFVHPLDAPNLEHPGVDKIPLPFPIQGVQSMLFVNDQDKMAIGSLNLVVIHSPGHSPGSVCYYLPDKKLLFSGDTLFEGSIGNIHLPTSEPEKMWLSLKALLQLPPDTRVVPGHGRDTMISQETWLSRAQEIFSE